MSFHNLEDSMLLASVSIVRIGGYTEAGSQELGHKDDNITSKLKVRSTQEGSEQANPNSPERNRTVPRATNLTLTTKNVLKYL